MNKIITNKVKCLVCSDIIESTHRHDFKYCKCGAIAVDGGKDYLKRLGEYSSWEDLSEFEKCKDCNTYIEYISEYHNPDHPLVKEKQTTLNTKLDVCVSDAEKRRIKWQFNIGGWWCPTCNKEHK